MYNSPYFPNLFNLLLKELAAERFFTNSTADNLFQSPLKINRGKVYLKKAVKEVL